MQELEMRIHDGDILVGVPSGQLGAPLLGDDLVGAEIVLLGPGCNAEAEGCATRLIIKGHFEPQFWEGCTASNQDCAGMALTTPSYAFQVIQNDGTCLTLCDPSVTEQDDGIAGTAVIFTGDVYDEGPGGVRIRTDEQLSLDEQKEFQIACYGTAISKLHFLRHTTAAQKGVPAQARIDRDRRQSMLQLITGDYCATGVYHTLNGLPLRLSFDRSPLEAMFDDVGLSGAQSVDALWSTTGQGATCLGTPRLLMATGKPAQELRDEINSDCANAPNAPNPLPLCDAVALQNAKGGTFGADYAISANTFP
jgi:hypothetical protein